MGETQGPPNIAFIILTPMRITVELPADIACHPGAARETLEALVIAGYQSRELTQREAGQLLGFSRIETEDFLGRHTVLYDYSMEELEAEADLLQRLHRPA